MADHGQSVLPALIQPVRRGSRTAAIREPGKRMGCSHWIVGHRVVDDDLQAIAARRQVRWQQHDLVVWQERP